ncbi:MAG: hypothetical protein AB1540_12060 [Bdellovibrionota bacterium]
MTTSRGPKENPKGSFRIILTLPTSMPRLDQVLLEAIRKQKQNLELKNISRTQFKTLFKEKRIRIKGQNAIPSSALAQGTTEIEILGFEDEQ